MSVSFGAAVPAFVAKAVDWLTVATAGTGGGFITGGVICCVEGS